MTSSTSPLNSSFSNERSPEAARVRYEYRRYEVGLAANNAFYVVEELYGNSKPVQPTLPEIASTPSVQANLQYTTEEQQWRMANSARDEIDNISRGA